MAVPGESLAGVNWKSSKPNTASVRSTGIAHGKKGGTVTITASASGVNGTTGLTVGTGTLSSVVISPAKPDLQSRGYSAVLGAGNVQ
jgi:trimeric autotransporter adhesin